jgi:cytochrome c oxidase subunit 3
MGSAGSARAGADGGAGGVQAASNALARANQQQRYAARLRMLLKIAAATSACFLLGQLWAWRDLIADGYYVASNAANAFFYLLTAVHGLHLLGGLVALARTIAKAWRQVDRMALQTSVELCAIYWHFLLAVWLVMFAMLAGEMNGFGALCRRVLS